MTTVAAVYENGVFRPKGPLDLDEGQEVNLSISQAAESTGDDVRYIARLKSAPSLTEVFRIIEAESSEPEIDVMELVNQSRRSTGFRMPDSQIDGATP